SSNRRRAKRNDRPNSNAAASGAVSKRPDQRLAMNQQSTVIGPTLSGFGEGDGHGLERRQPRRDDGALACEQLEPHGAANPQLNRIDERVERVAERREPRS